MTLQSIFGLFGAALLATAALGLALRRAKPGTDHGFQHSGKPWSVPDGTWLRAGVLAAAFGAAWLPIDGLPLAGYLRGVIGDLSVPTLLLAAAGIATSVSGRRVLAGREMATGRAAVLAAALFLYPMALGLGGFDPYVLGYGSWGFAAALALVVLAAWAARMDKLAWAIVAAIAAWLAGLLDSANLWDYLIDPLLAAYALAWWTRR